MGAVMNPENHLQSHVSLPATSGEIGSFTITDLHTYTHTHTYCESVRGEGDHIYTRTHSHTRSTHTQYICARRRISQTHTHTHTHTHTLYVCAQSCGRVGTHSNTQGTYAPSEEMIDNGDTQTYTHTHRCECMSVQDWHLTFFMNFSPVGSEY
jgi:hypothetical protein